MPEGARDASELTWKLAIQRRALRASCASYDAGELWEAERLAVTASIIVNDGRRSSRSLLTHLGLKETLRFVSTTRGFRMEYASPPGSSRELSPPTPLILIATGQAGVRFEPMFKAHAQIEWTRHLSFGQWYEEDIFKTTGGRPLSRKNLILSLRDQDGGAHIDAALRDESYAALVRDPASEMRVGGKPVPYAHYATMRQIAWELELTLEALDRP